MSGHSKWSQIKHKKAASDAKKGVLFDKLARAITVAARGNPDPTTNLRLDAEVRRARAANMPSENIERAIRRVTEHDAAALQEVQAEFVGPGNSTIIATAITDNSNRTIMELRGLATHHGARAADAGSIRWMFDLQGLVRVVTGDQEKEALQLAAIDAGAKEVERTFDGFIVRCRPEDLSAVERALGEVAQDATIAFVPKTTGSISEADMKSLESFTSALEQHEDVQKVFTNTNPYGDISWH